MCLISFLLEGRFKIVKIGLAMRVKIVISTAKSGKKTNLLVIMRVKILQKIGLQYLTNWNQFKKVNGWKQCTKSIHYYCIINIGGQKLMYKKYSLLLHN